MRIWILSGICLAAVLGALLAWGRLSTPLEPSHASTPVREAPSILPYPQSTAPVRHNQPPSTAGTEAALPNMAVQTVQPSQSPGAVSNVAKAVKGAPSSTQSFRVEPFAAISQQPTRQTGILPPASNAGFPQPAIGIASVAATTPAADEIEVVVPETAEIPLMLFPVVEEEGFTPEEITRMEKEADKFVETVTNNGTTSEPDPARWKSAQQNSDELFRTWYGTDAYMAMSAKRYLESQGITPAQP